MHVWLRRDGLPRERRWRRRVAHPTPERFVLKSWIKSAAIAQTRTTAIAQTRKLLRFLLAQTSHDIIIKLGEVAQRAVY